MSLNQKAVHIQVILDIQRVKKLFSQKAKLYLVSIPESLIFH